MAERDRRDILDIIKERRSIRKYSPRFIGWEYISRILDAGRYAPSSGNLQNWKFITILDESIKEKIAEASLEQYWMMEAPVIIIVTAEPEKVIRYYGEKGKLYSIQNTSAVIENMLLEAVSLGLGSCWIGAFNEDKIKDILKIPPQDDIAAILPVGFPDEEGENLPKLPIDKVVYFNKWGETISDPVIAFKEYSDLWSRTLKKAIKGIDKLRSKIKSSNKDSIKDSDR